jgi:hypothetical protein
MFQKYEKTLLMSFINRENQLTNPGSKNFSSKLPNFARVKWRSPSIKTGVE